MTIMEVPHYLLKLWRHDNSWLTITNRKQKFIPAVQGAGISLLDEYTSELRTARQYPAFSEKIFSKAIQQYGFKFSDTLKQTTPAKISFIIGHRGVDKIENLKLVLKTITAQADLAVECIVVEQSHQAELENQIPEWVDYYHLKVDESALYNRSLSFNYGVTKANSELLILHDNDLLVPRCYAKVHFDYFKKGYELVNQKRYIFGLNQQDTVKILASGDIEMGYCPQYILQNAKGGGSLAITKQAYERIGGYDNRFQGWGGEDNELWQRAQVLKIYPFAQLPLIHLWHPPQSDKRGGSHGGGLHTEKLMDELGQISIYNRINDLCKRSMK